MSVPRADFGAAYLAATGIVLLIGGQTSATADTAAVDLFNPAGIPIKPAAPMSAPRSAFTATALPNGKVLVAGGISRPGGPALATAELYDPIANIWSAAPSMAQAREHHSAILMTNGKVFVAGGDGGIGGTDPSSFEIYDPLTNTWSGTQPFYGKRPNGPVVVQLGTGNVWIYGGTDVILPGNQEEFYDPTTGGQDQPGGMPDTIDFATAVVLNDQNVLVAGGIAAYQPGGALNTSQVGQPLSWLAHPLMIAGHCRHTMTLLRSGRVLVAGGRCATSDSIAVAEIYEPIGRKWFLVAPMQTARGYHTAVQLQDGRV
ncbi:MAG TPA: kelch repeat-containing protein, partial [Candidatus Dormibacteraeota bacterium]|nr:kelch repeat-containing protein [Candidatus Dormibacteraeota bacterium]